MSSTHGSILTLGIQRLIGTVIGAIGGAIFAITLGSNPWSLGISVLDYPINELLRFFTFFYTMEEVGSKLQRMTDTLTNS